VEVRSGREKVQWRMQGEHDTLHEMDEGRKRVLLIAAAILAARKLAQYDSVVKVPATVSAVETAIDNAEQILKAIDRRWPPKSV
jgi:hypothetical protein